MVVSMNKSISSFLVTLLFVQSLISCVSQNLRNDETNVISNWPQDCDYFVFVLEVDKVANNRISRLNVNITANLNSEVQVKSYDIYLNSAEHMMRQATSSGLAASGQFDFYIGSSTSGKNITLKPKCSRDKMTAGWFDPVELTNNISPLIIDLKVEYNGKDYSVYSVYSPDTELQYRYGKPEMTRNVNAAMDKAHKALIAKIKANDFD